MSNGDANGRRLGEDWWRTGIIRMEPGEIRLRGYSVEDLIGRVGFAETIWLMLRGELPSPGQARLLEAALVAGVDHGPQAPSIAAARMAVSCGLGMNGAMASAINMLDDVHGGAGEQALEFYLEVAAGLDAGGEIEAVVDERIGAAAAAGVPYIPGFGHRFHPVDPRAPRLLQLVEDAARSGVVSRRFAAIGRAVEAGIERRRGRRITMNIDGATAVIYGELGFPPPLCRGLFVLSRSVGILAHAFEESQSGKRNKGPLPRSWLWTYDGSPDRKIGDDEAEPS